MVAAVLANSVVSGHSLHKPPIGRVSAAVTTNGRIHSKANADHSSHHFFVQSFHNFTKRNVPDRSVHSARSFRKIARFRPNRPSTTRTWCVRVPHLVFTYFPRNHIFEGQPSRRMRKKSRGWGRGRRTALGGRISLSPFATDSTLPTITWFRSYFHRTSRHFPRSTTHKKLMYRSKFIRRPPVWPVPGEPHTGTKISLSPFASDSRLTIVPHIQAEFHPSDRISQAQPPSK